MATSNKPTVVVTGGSSGIGLGIAERFIDDGWNVIITARNGKRLDQVVEKLGPAAVAAQGDVGDIADVKRLATLVQSCFGTLDALVNNAGKLEVLPIGSDLEEAADMFERTMNANVRGSFLTAHALAPLLRSPGGRIINLGSIVAHTGGTVPGFTAYAASKGAVHGLTLALARELGPRGINVTTVAPGFTAETGQTEEFDDERIAKIVGNIPLARGGEIADLANAVAWLASPQSSYVTGMTLPVNGGWAFYQ